MGPQRGQQPRTIEKILGRGYTDNGAADGKQPRTIERRSRGREEEEDRDQGAEG